jgi:glycosyltransferase involved in cell wall biosynthesis
MRPSQPLPSICLLTETYYPLTGGGETQARSLAENLVAKGFKVFIATRRVTTSLKKVEEIGSIPIYRIRPVGLGQSKRWGMLLWALVALARMRRRYDIIYVSGFKALGVSAVLISKLLGKTCILKADSNGEMSGEFFAGGLKKLRLTPSSYVVRIFLCVRNKILRKANCFVAITSGIVAELTSQGVKPGLIYSIPNSVDAKKFCPVSISQKYSLWEKLNFPKKKMIITYSGRLVSYKGLPLLVGVAQKILREFKDVGFVLVGSGGIDIHNCEAELKEYVITNGLEDSIYFPGQVDNVHEYLQASDVFVSPTEKDAFPLALIEAMACGLPVISTPVGGIQEIITDRQNGLLVEPRNFQQLEGAICALLADTAFRGSLGKAAAHTVKERYCEEIVTAKYAELFSNALRPEGFVCSR